MLQGTWNLPKENKAGPGTWNLAEKHKACLGTCKLAEQNQVGLGTLGLAGTHKAGPGTWDLAKNNKAGPETWTLARNIKPVIGASMCCGEHATAYKFVWKVLNEGGDERTQGSRCSEGTSSKQWGSNGKETAPLVSPLGSPRTVLFWHNRVQYPCRKGRATARGMARIPTLVPMNAWSCCLARIVHHWNVNSSHNNNYTISISEEVIAEMCPMKVGIDRTFGRQQLLRES